MIEIWRLFGSFFKIGLFMIGGGYTTIPLITRECVYRRRWLEEDEMADVLAVSQALPGVMSINVAVAVGGRRRGALGCAVAALGVALPAFAAMVIIAALSVRLYEYDRVNAAFAGVRPAAAGLIAAAAIRLFKPMVKTIWQLIIAIACFGMILAGLPAPFALLICGTCGVCAGLVNRVIKSRHISK